MRAPILLLFALLVEPIALAAQPASATIIGVVRDTTGGVIRDAGVQLVQRATQARRSTRTGDAGTYAFPALPMGSYSIRIAYPGFREHEQAVRVYAGEVVRVDVELVPATLGETVTIVDGAPLVRTETAALAHVVDRSLIAALPLNGRNFVTLAALAPGVALPPGSAFPRINGGRPRTNEYLFDGISVLQPEPGQVAFLPVLDAIEAFTIERNSPAAEFGRFNGGVVNLTTRSGTNDVSGTLFGFVRHEALNARNYFAPPDTAKPLFRRTQAGGVLGGPILRHRTFFFGDYQGQRQNIGRTVISTVPTMLQRQGVFVEPIGGRVPVIYDPVTRQPFNGNTIPADRLDPASLSLVARYPLPTSPGAANNFRRTAMEINDQDQFDLRLDHRVRNAGDLAFTRFSSFRDRFEPVSPLPDGSGAVSGTPGPQRTRAHAFVASYAAALSD
ncbi:MAG: PEGA domain-containing protein, partial [Acidobacteria bacterium]